MTVRSWAWTKCCDGVDVPRGAYIPTKTVGTYAPPAVSVTSNYSYDSIYELTQAVVGGTLAEGYSYDAVGNRLTSAGPTSYSYNASNELTSSSAAVYAYDNNGNTISKTTSLGTTSYNWDFENRLASVTLPGTGGTVNFKYDPLGRRIEKVAPTGTTVYAYDGDNVIEELGGGGNLLAHCTQGAGMDEPLAMYRGLTMSYFHADGLGSITSLTDGSGQLAASYVYDSFGKLTASAGTVTNPFQYTARESDSETGLYYYRARYYDPQPGRFLSEDPAGFYGGFNFYAYVKNDPGDFVDPTGLECRQVSPWTEIPSLWGPNGPTPYRTVQDGLFWVRTGWGFSSLGLVPDYTHCVCQWVATHTRIRKYYRETITERAEFKCDCPPPPRTELRTRTRTKEYDVVSPGNSIIPTSFGSTGGTTFQPGAMAGSNPRNKQNDECTCAEPTP